MSTTVPDPRPQPPPEPALEDCCRSGCCPCVFDLYHDALERYEAALTAWEARHQDIVAPASSPQAADQ